MGTKSINQDNVGRISERIVSNELEFHGFRVSDLNKEGTSANADLLAAKDGKTWQVQVKGATHSPQDHGWWFNYGYCDQTMIADRNKPTFNRKSSFYRAQIIVLVSVKAPSDYRCVVLAVETAEQLAQINLNYAFRTTRKDGAPRKPHKMWGSLDYIPKNQDARKIELLKAEQEVLNSHLGRWDILDSTIPPQV